LLLLLPLLLLIEMTLILGQQTPVTVQLYRRNWCYSGIQPHRFL